MAVASPKHTAAMLSTTEAPAVLFVFGRFTATGEVVAADREGIEGGKWEGNDNEFIFSFPRFSCFLLSGFFL